ncbi:glycosyltransferase [uncultured Microscilla sp.]|uniref:glycosyltransferase n=1 Tax=uncultured Microscilla sp. TaxID=432653 RepID=UPI00261A9436|nr:glycosyltransferase [uncultured Microscilla sp.]
MLLSVLLPFYNAEKTLVQAIESILAQTLPNFKLVLVNNASTDQSRAIAQSFVTKDDRVLLIDEPQPGIAYALNAGLAHITTPYIARMDADDIALPQRLEKQLSFLEQHPAIHLVSCLVQHQSTELQTKGYQRYVDWINTLITPTDISLHRFVESPLAHPSVMFRASAVKRWGNYRQGNFPEDYELWLRWLGQGAHMAKVSETLLVWNDTPTRLSRTDARYSPQEFYKTKAYYLAQWLQKHNIYAPNIWVWGAGKLSRKRARLLEQSGTSIQGYFDLSSHHRLNVPCLHFHDIPPPGKCFIVSYVGNWGARDQIRAHLLKLGYCEGIDFLLAS